MPFTASITIDFGKQCLTLPFLVMLVKFLALHIAMNYQACLVDVNIYNWTSTMKSTMNIINCLIVIDIRNSYICGVIEPISLKTKPWF